MLSKLTSFVALSKMVQAQSGYEYKTNHINAVSCAGSHTTCIDEGMTSGSSSCCAWPEEHELHEYCTSKFKYCSTGLEQSHYKILTYPSYGCPGGDPLLYNHERMN